MSNSDSTVPYGHCHCGCGGETTISKTNDRRAGAVKGEPRLYIRGHFAKNNGPDYLLEDRGHETECWIWQKGASTLFYGHKWDAVIRRRVLAHRFYYEERYGSIPSGTELDHRCRVPLCVNPEHLEPVTHKENIRRGAHTKLTAQLADELRERYATGEYTYQQLAKEYGLHPVYVGRVVRRQTWA